MPPVSWRPGDEDSLGRGWFGRFALTCTRDSPVRAPESLPAVLPRACSISFTGRNRVASRDAMRFRRSRRSVLSAGDDRDLRNSASASWIGLGMLSANESSHSAHGSGVPPSREADRVTPAGIRPNPDGLLRTWAASGRATACS